MKTYEGIMKIKWYKNDSGGDCRPLTIDVENKCDLKIELAKIKNDFLKKGENNEKAYSVFFEMSERK